MKAFFRPRAKVVNSTRAHFFAGAGISDQQDRCITAGNTRDLFDRRHESRCLPNEALYAELRNKIELTALDTVLSFTKSLSESVNSQSHVIERQRGKEKIIDCVEQHFFAFRGQPRFPVCQRGLLQIGEDRHSG